MRAGRSTWSRSARAPSPLASRVARLYMSQVLPMARGAESATSSPARSSPSTSSGGMPLWVIGAVVAAGVLTELGPMLTGIVLVGRVGASIAAELAAMRVTEQIDALEAMGRDPVAILVV